jgi:hypothetical protein
VFFFFNFLFPAITFHSNLPSEVGRYLGLPAAFVGRGTVGIAAVLARACQGQKEGRFPSPNLTELQPNHHEPAPHLQTSISHWLL